MKVIDLFNKIATGEKPPKKIKINNIIFYHTNNPMLNYLYKDEIEHGWTDYGCVQLDAEVEIIEDEDEDNNRINIYNIKKLNEYEKPEVIISKINELAKAIKQLNSEFYTFIEIYAEKTLNELHNKLKGE